MEDVDWGFKFFEEIVMGYKNLRFGRLAGAAIVGLTAALTAASAQAEDFKLKWSMDWAWQGSQSFAVVHSRIHER